MIYISDEQIQELTKTYFGTELTDIEMTSLEKLYAIEFASINDRTREGAIAHVILTLVHAIGTIIGSHRDRVYPRKLSDSE